MVEKINNIETPDVDSQMTVDDAKILGSREAKKRLIVLKKMYQHDTKTAMNMEEKNPLFGRARREKKALEKSQKAFEQAKVVGEEEWRIRKKEGTFNYDKSAYERSLNRMTPEQQASFEVYCSLQDKNEKNKELIAVLEKQAQNSGFFGRKGLSIVGTLLILGGIAVPYMMNKEKGETKPLQASVVQKTNSEPEVKRTTPPAVEEAKKPVVQEQATKPQKAEAGVSEQKAQEKTATLKTDFVQDFEKAIKKYNPRTQEAMRMSIDWLKKYNDLVKARFAKDGAGVAAAKLEMDAYRDAMQTLDKNVWYVINDKMGPAFVEAGKANPTQDFDYSLVYRFLPKRYDSHIKAINAPEGQKQLNSVVQRQANEGR